MVARRNHHCHAEGCQVSVPPKRLMCGRHWMMVPIELRMPVLETYRPGQENDMRPSIASLDAIEVAVNYIRRLEGYRERPLPSVLLAPFSGPAPPEPTPRRQP